MKRISDLKTAEKILAHYVPGVKELLGKDLTLKRMQPLMQTIGNPEAKLKIIHVAGTSGKTSTSYYISSLLTQTGLKVGLTVSPHVDSLLERIQINTEPIGEVEFCRELTEFLTLIKNVNPIPTYFELLMAFAYWYFAKLNVDYAVIETGLGGLFDGSNVAKRQDKICVITDIGLDHMRVLGNSLPEIAAQKAGIIWPGNTVVMYEQSLQVMEAFQQRCDEQGATFQTISASEQNSFETNAAFLELPNYQKRNWSLARKVYELIVKRDKLLELKTEQLAKTWAAQIPGRMEIIQVRNKKVILDGAHNTQKMTAFRSSFESKFPGVKPAVLLSVRDKKDFTDLIDQLLPLASCLILTSFRVVQDLTHTSTSLQAIAEYCEAHGFSDVVVEPDQHKAFERLTAADSEVCIITGSFYLLSQLKSTEGLLNDKVHGSN